MTSMVAGSILRTLEGWQAHALYRQLGANIRVLRQTRKWSQDVLAESAGLHRAHMGEIERGETNVTIQTLKILVDTLEVTISNPR